MSADTAWAAGLFEGEGCISTFRQPHLLRAALVTSDLDVLKRFEEIVGVGKVERHKVYSSLGRKPLWRWTANMGEAETAIRLLSPYLGLRRTIRAEELLRARAEHIENVTSARDCERCGQNFRPEYGSNSARQRYCSRDCQEGRAQLCRSSQ